MVRGFKIVIHLIKVFHYKGFTIVEVNGRDVFHYAHELFGTYLLYGSFATRTAGLMRGFIYNLEGCVSIIYGGYP